MVGVILKSKIFETFQHFFEVNRDELTQENQGIENKFKNRDFDHCET